MGYVIFFSIYTRDLFVFTKRILEINTYRKTKYNNFGYGLWNIIIDQFIIENLSTQTRYIISIDT